MPATMYFYYLRDIIKGEDSSKRLTVLYLLIASKHSAFSFTEVPACYSEEIYLERSDLEVTILNCTWQPGCIYVMSYSHLKLAARRKTCN